MWVRKDEAGIRAAIQEKSRELKSPVKPLIFVLFFTFGAPTLYALGFRSSRPVPTHSPQSDFWGTYVRFLPIAFIVSLIIGFAVYLQRRSRGGAPFEAEKTWYCPHCNQGRVHQGKRCTACGQTGIEPFEFYSWVEEPPTE